MALQRIDANREADPPQAKAALQHLPGQAVRLACELRAGGERKYCFTDHAANASRLTLVRAIKARWVCEQAHRQLHARSTRRGHGRQVVS